MIVKLGMLCLTLTLTTLPAQAQVGLNVDVATGGVSIVGSESIAGFELSSASNSLNAANYVSTNLSGLSAELFRSDGLISYGTFGSPVAIGGSAFIGNIFRVNGSQDLQFSWLTGNNDSIVGQVSYVPEPASVMALAALGGLAMLRRRSA